MGLPNEVAGSSRHVHPNRLVSGKVRPTLPLRKHERCITYPGGLNSAPVKKAAALEFAMAGLTVSSAFPSLRVQVNLLALQIKTDSNAADRDQH